MDKIVALVTGGSSGLGLATVEHLLSKNVKGVVVIDRNELNYSKSMQKNAERLLFYKGDITSENDVSLALIECERKFEYLNVVLNCAAIAVVKKTFDGETNSEHDLQSFKSIIDVNLTGTFNVCRLSAKMMVKNQETNGLRGVIINVSSVASFEGKSGAVAYSASKSAVNGMTLPMARDLAPFGIRVNTISPGIFATPLLSCEPEDALKSFIDATPCPKRFGDPKEFAHLVQAIIENAMINGEVIRIDGAFRMQ